MRSCGGFVVARSYPHFHFTVAVKTNGAGESSAITKGSENRFASLMSVLIVFVVVVVVVAVTLAS